MSQPATNLLTTPQAAEYLGLKPGTLEVWRVQGRGPKFCRLGRAIRYRIPALETYISEGEISSTSEG